MHAEQTGLLVVIEMSRPDSLSTAVSRQVHFETTHPEHQLTKALSVCRGGEAGGWGGGGCSTKTTVVHVNVVCVRVWPERPVCIYEGMSGCALHIAAYSTRVANG